MEVFVEGTLHSFWKDNSNICMYYSSTGIYSGVGALSNIYGIGAGIGNENIIWVWLGFWKLLETRMLYHRYGVGYL